MVKPNPMLCAPINNNWGGSAGILIFFVLPVYVVLCILLYDFFIREQCVKKGSCTLKLFLPFNGGSTRLE